MDKIEILRSDITTIEVDAIVNAANTTLFRSISVEDLKKSEDFDPYFNLKVVLVEEGGQLKIGYFEFLPPSMMD